ncbi:MAG: SMC-Scp complex subunit ScpB [Ruminococcaceae bacterium]|nr:SMC-Scp complex subunit ScpB [Oscillospiraceae bacterium]
MNMSHKYDSIIESILFAAGDSLPKSQIAEILEISQKEVEEQIENLKTFYKENKRGFKIIEIEDEYQLCTVEENFRYIQCIKEPKRRQGLSQAAFETLSVVAYNQPVTRGSIEFIRGVNSDGSVNKLLERGLIEERGRLDAPGRPILYGTTLEFLRSFGLRSLKDLPELEAVQLELDYDIEKAKEDNLQLELSIDALEESINED